MWCPGPVALQHTESSRTRDRTCAPCTGRQIPNRWIPREVQGGPLFLNWVGLSQAPSARPLPRPWSGLPTHAVAAAELPRPSLSIRFITEVTGFQHPCVSYVGQAKLNAKTAVLPRATRQVRETCRPGGWQARLASASVCSPKKGRDKYRHRITQTQPGKTGSEPRLQPWPGLTFTCLPPPCLLPGLPHLFPGHPACKLQDSPSCLPSGGGAETEAQREQGTRLTSHSRLGAGDARAALGESTYQAQALHQPRLSFHICETGTWYPRPSTPLSLHVG